MQGKSPATSFDRAWVGYGATVLCVGLAALLRWRLDDVLGDTAPFATFYLAVIIAAMGGGAGPALVATVLGAMVVFWFFMEPRGALALGDATATIQLVLYLATGTGSSLLAGWAHAARRRVAQQARDALSAAEVIRKSKERYRLVSRATHDVIWDWDLASGEMFWNEAVEVTFGYPLNEVSGDFSWWHDRVHPDDRSRVIASIRKTIDDPVGHRWTGEYLFLHRNGEWVSVLDRALVARDADGGAVRMVGAMMDLTERKRAEEALRQVAAQFRELAEAIPQLVWIMGPDGRHEYYNGRWRDYTGKSLEEGCGEGWLAVLHPDDYGPTLAAWRENLLRGESYQLEYRMRRARDGTYRWMLARAVAVRDERGCVTRWFGTCTDIQEQKRLQEELRAARIATEEAKAAVEQASRAKDHFLAVLSHELRTPLTPVLAAAALMEEDDRLLPQYREDATLIRRNAELEARLIDDLLDITRIARGKISLEREPVDLCETIRRAVEVCQPDLEGKGLHLSLDLGGEQPHIVDADPSRLQQVFWNLIRNAIKFTPPGGRIAVRCRRRGGGGGAEGGGEVETEVADSGEGIDPAMLPRIFNDFEQGGAHVTRQFGGLGLGLAITKDLVQKHGGTIEPHSEGKGKGATFRVTLPLRPADVRSQSDHPPAQRRTSPTPPREAPPLHVLLVEDHLDTAKVMRRLLEMDGHQVRHATTVAAARELAGAHRFDLLISDLGLPDGSGTGLLRSLRDGGQAPPAIALSGYGQAQDLERTRAAGFAAHLTKPIKRDRLSAAIAAVLAAPAQYA